MHPILDDVRQFLDLLETVQHELAALLQRKRTALRDADLPALQQVAGTESELVKRMHVLAARRRQILQQAGKAGLPSDSLLDLAVGDDGDPRRLRTRIMQARQVAEHIHAENLIHWIVAQRAWQHHSRMLDLIAHRGQKAPTYANGPARDAAGGAMLDASI